jgi:hypothetical protein
VTAITAFQKDPGTGKNILWGWGRLFQVAAKYPNFRDMFHEARYNLALCRFNMARVQKSKSDEQDQLSRAKDAILQTQQLFGSGAEWETWKPRYDALMKEIQKALGERPLGLPEVKVPGAVAAPAAKEAGESKAKPAAGPPPLNLNPAA